MPSGSTFYDATWTNVGPLTTTFTPSAACASATNALAVVDEASDFVTAYASCDPMSYEKDCHPSAEALNSINSNADKSKRRSPLVYFSPGLACPSGWTVAGTVKGGETSKPSGLFTTTWKNDDLNVPLEVRFQEILDDDETLQWCCPKDWDISYGFGLCQSKVGKPEDFGITTACANYLPHDAYTFVKTYDGSSLKSEVASFRPSWTGELSTTKITVSEGFETPAIDTFVPVLALISKEGDADNGGSDDNDDDDDDGDGDSDGKNDEDKDDAASGVRLSGVLSFAVVGTSMLFGAGLLGAW